jgi:isochorismate synthase
MEPRIDTVAAEPGEPRAEAPYDAQGVARFLEEALMLCPDGPVLVIVPAPVGDPLGALRRLRRQDAWLLSRSASSGEPAEVVLGVGSAGGRRLVGEARLAQLGEELATGGALARALTRHVHPASRSALVERLPLQFVGLAFAPGAAEDEPWRELGDGRVVTPRWTYLREGEHAVLAWAGTARWRGQPPVVRGQLEALVAALSAPSPRPRARPQLVGDERGSPDGYEAHVRTALSAIARGELEKVVTARRAAIATGVDLVAEDVLAALPEAGATRFLVRVGGTTFVGATPERLFRKRGRQLATEALAGTRASAGESAERVLLASDKDHDEHAPVRRAIVTSLEAVGARVRAETTPRIKRVANLVHLRTAITAELPAELDAAGLLAALHPTPAVAGSPAREALAWIARHEAPRGWYAGPLGWVDARGDAELLVALRAAVVRGARAWIYAGGGIIAGSDPASEYAETELKMTPLLRAVGAEPQLGVEPSQEPSRNVERPS